MAFEFEVTLYKGSTGGADLRPRGTEEEEEYILVIRVQGSAIQMQLIKKVTMKNFVVLVVFALPLRPSPFKLTTLPLDSLLNNRGYDFKKS